MLERKIGGEFRTLGLQLGYCYENSPICVPDGTPPPPDDPATYTANARPGARAPHVWIGENKSTLDLFGRGFVLLRFPGAPDPAALAAAAASRGVPLTIIDIDRPDAAADLRAKAGPGAARRPYRLAGRRLAGRSAGALIDRVRGA